MNTDWGKCENIYQIKALCVAWSRKYDSVERDLERSRLTQLLNLNNVYYFKFGCTFQHSTATKINSSLHLQILSWMVYLHCHWAENSISCFLYIVLCFTASSWTHTIHPCMSCMCMFTCLFMCSPEKPKPSSLWGTESIIWICSQLYLTF